MTQCMDYSPILVPTAVLWINTNLPPATVCADLAMCSVMKGLHSVLLQVTAKVVLSLTLSQGSNACDQCSTNPGNDNAIRSMRS